MSPCYINKSPFHDLHMLSACKYFANLSAGRLYKRARKKMSKVKPSSIPRGQLYHVAEKFRKNKMMPEKRCGLTWNYPPKYIFNSLFPNSVMKRNGMCKKHYLCKIFCVICKNDNGLKIQRTIFSF